MFDLVTGGAGFIGSHLVDRLLAEGRRVRVLDSFVVGRRQNLAHHTDNPALEIVEDDVANPTAVLRAVEGADRIFHLAARADVVPSIQEPEAYFRSNVDGTFAVMEAARRCAVRRIVYVASSSCYGIPEQYPTPENTQADPRTPMRSRNTLASSSRFTGLRSTGCPAYRSAFSTFMGRGARTSGTYGAVFGVFLAQLLAGKPLTVVGDGEQTRDFTYVSDAVDALLTVAASDKVGTVYNVGSGKPVSVNELVRLLGSPETIHIPKRPGEPDCTFADITAIQRDLGWRPKVPLAEGIKTMLANIDYWRDAPVWTVDSIERATADWFRLLDPQTTKRSEEVAHG